jgi:cerevisin
MRFFKYPDTRITTLIGLPRLSHRPKLTFETFNSYLYDFNLKGGGGVDVYVIDTGINTKHVEF